MSTGFKGPIVHGPRSTAEGFKYRNGLGMMNCAEYVVMHDDFIGPVAANVPNGWAAAIVDADGTTTTYATATTGANGVLTLASATASAGAAFYGAKSIQLLSGKKFFMEARFRTDDVTDNTIQFGLSDLTATTNPEDLWTTTAANLVTFGLGDGDSNPKMLVDASNSGTSFQTQTVKGCSVNTWHTLAIAFDGSQVMGFVDGDWVMTWASAASTIPTATALAPFFGHINGNGAGGNLVLVDYVRLVVER